jgi:hypothetical protein
LPLSAAIMCGADFILAFSLIRRIILKSKRCPLLDDLLMRRHRILMSGIRNMGERPCPRCTIPKSMLHMIGTKQDRINRFKLARVDDHKRRLTISAARRAIYQNNFAVDSAGVERMLKPQSLVPTSVTESNR